MEEYTVHGAWYNWLYVRTGTAPGRRDKNHCIHFHTCTTIHNSSSIPLGVSHEVDRFTTVSTRESFGNSHSVAVPGRPSRNLGPPENSLVAYSLCKCTSRHSPSTSSKTIREIDSQWAHFVRSSSLPIEHPKPPFDHKSLLTWASVTSCRFPLANITLHNLLLIATILHDLVSIVTGWHQPPNPPWNPNKLLTDRKKCILK